jgi:GTPase SAR1 family protein
MNGMVCFSGFFLWRYKKTARKAVLLMGLSDAGKTLIYTQLLHHKFVRTHTSVKENSGEYAFGKVRTVISYNVYSLDSMLRAL